MSDIVSLANLFLFYKNKVDDKLLDLGFVLVGFIYSSGHNLVPTFKYQNYMRIFYSMTSIIINIK